MLDQVTYSAARYGTYTNSTLYLYFMEFAIIASS